MTIARLLTRLLPSIYADPQRLRKCANPDCRQPCRAAYCSPACQATDRADQQVW